MLNQRRKLLVYLRRTNFDRFANTLSRLDLKDNYAPKVEWTLSSSNLSSPSHPAHFHMHLLPRVNRLSRSRLSRTALYFDPPPYPLAHHPLLPISCCSGTGPLQDVRHNQDHEGADIRSQNEADKASMMSLPATAPSNGNGSGSLKDSPESRRCLHMVCVFCCTYSSRQSGAAPLRIAAL